MRCHTALCSRIIERKDSIGGAARLERADLLKIFALKKQLRSARLIQPRTCQHWSAMNVSSNPFAGSADTIKVERHNLSFSSASEVVPASDQNHDEIVRDQKSEVRDQKSDNTKFAFQLGVRRNAQRRRVIYS